MNRTLLAIISLMLPIFAVGCATSYPFQVAANQTGPVLVSMGQGYLRADTTLDPLTESQRAAELAALQSASTPLKSVTEPAWENAFENVQAWLGNYIRLDTALDSGEKVDRLGALVYGQQVINAEKTRSFGVHNAATQPSN